MADDHDKWLRISKQELQEMLDRAADQAVTQGIALARWMLRDWVRSMLRTMGVNLLGFLWKPLLLAVLGTGAWLLYKLRDYI